MQVPEFTRQIPLLFDKGCTLLISQGTKAQQWVTEYATAKIDEISHSDYWKTTAKPIYERNFAPLTKLDYQVFTGCVATALIATKFAVDRFTIGALPLAAGAGTLLVMGAYYFSRHRVHQHFNEVAWDKIDQIRNFAHQTTPTNQKFADISKRRACLMRPEFERWGDDLKLLDEKIREFRVAVLKPQRKDKAEGPNFRDSKQAFIEYLEGLQRKLAGYRDIPPLLNEVNEEENEVESDSESEVDTPDSHTPPHRILVNEQEMGEPQAQIVVHEEK